MSNVGTHFCRQIRADPHYTSLHCHLEGKANDTFDL